MEGQEINNITFSVQFNLINNQREVACALVDQDKRIISVIEFADNEHYSSFESAILQNNPMQQNESKFVVICLYPDLLTEKDKIKDIYAQCDFEVVIKDRKDFTLMQSFHNDMDLILERPLRQYIQESASTYTMGCVQAILNQLGLARDTSNMGKFRLQFMGLDRYMKLDLAAINALMILPKVGIEQRFTASDSVQHLSLVEYLNRCKTQMGSRCLKRWIKMPLQNENEINKRLTVVEFLLNNTQYRQYLQDEFLKKISDLDKLYAKFYKVNSQKRNNAGLGDCIKVYSLVINIKNLVTHTQKQLLKNDTNILHKVILDPFIGVLEDFKKFEEMIERSIDIQKAYQNEFIVNPKYSAKLIELNKLIQKSLNLIENIRQDAQNDLGIDVQLSESGSQTYVFEANKKYADDAFRKKGSKQYKTLTVKKGLITFTTEQLQAEVVEYVHLKEQYDNDQKELVDKILKIVSGYYPAMEIASQCISELDVYCSFAQVAEQAPRKFVRPLIGNEYNKLIIQESRHPLLEVVDSNCIVNDLDMEKQNARLHIITGPNMGGKSTFIRQIAICALMAHIGSFVPSSYAQLPVLDAIITRVGASDMQLRGISTFMSEMLEASCMIKTATSRSLIIIDELGRGTSTSEGFGIAWAIAEYIALQLKSWCLFATHFHEMTSMEKQIDGVKNYYVSCLTIDNKITMQYKVRRGAVDRSYGLLVAEMLKFPKQVLEDAKNKANELENFNIINEQTQTNDTKIDEELIFDSIEQEIQYYAQRSTISQKEAVIKLFENSKQWSKDKLQQEILKILTK